MNKFIFFVIYIFYLTSILIAQVDQDDFNCYYESDERSSQRILKAPVTGSIDMAIILCVEKNQNKVVDISQFMDPLKLYIPNYFDKATFDNFHVNIPYILVESTNEPAGIATVFELPDTVVLKPPIDTSFVVNPWMVEYVLNKADSIYDFNDFDSNSDGIVDFLAFMVIKFRPGNSNGTTGLSTNSFYKTNDTTVSGDTVRIDGTGYLGYSGDRAIIQRKYNANAEKLIGISVHELGHALFDFPDMDHTGGTNWPHYALGQFDAMSDSKGFNSMASLYNPFLRVNKGWITPTPITTNQTLNFSDFDDNGNIYYYALPDYSYSSSPSVSTSAGQELYFSYYSRPSSVRWQQNWPIPENPGGDARGILIWHTRSGSGWSDRYNLPIDIEAAHGKWDWIEDDAGSIPPPGDKKAINSPVQNPLTGLDSLEVRYSYIWHRYDSTDASGDPCYTAFGVYPDYRKGSASCFFDPLNPKKFTFYSNPNSNHTVTTGYPDSRSLVSGFKMHNLRIESGTVKADFVVGRNANKITENVTLPRGTWRFIEDIVINSGKTLTIQPGTTLRFYGGANITVNGNLHAVGTSSNRITFDFINKTDYNGIRFICTNGTLKYCNIKNADKGIYLSSGGSNPTIEHCNITNNNYGIYLGMDSYNLDYIRYNTISNNTYDGIYIDCGGPIQSIDHNTITNNGRYGIYSYYRDPDISYNTISDNSNAGIYLYYYSSPYIGTLNHINENGTGINSYRSQPYLGYNEIEDNSMAIFANSSSSINMSMDNLVKNGSIGLKADNSSTITVHYCPIVGYDDPGDYACYANHNSTINATHNCWDTSQPTIYTANGGVVYWQPADPPCGGLAKIASSGNTAGEVSEEMPTSENTGPFDKDLEQAFQHIMDKKYNSAIAIYQKKYKEKNSQGMKRFILNQLAFCYKKSKRTDFIAYLNKQVRPDLEIDGELYAITIELENSFLLKKRNYDSVLKNLEYLKTNFSENEEINKNALYGLLHLTYSYSKDTTAAKKYLDELCNKYPDDELTHNAMLYLGETEKYLLAKQNMELRNEQTETEIAEKIIPEKFALKDNYPNPFNPVTTIQYNLPNDANVILEVFDIQGQKVKTLVNGFKEAGYYEVIFDGSHIASGVYIYKIKASEFSSSKRMLLIK